jgi:hypothetical protein
MNNQTTEPQPTRLVSSTFRLDIEVRIRVINILTYLYEILYIKWNLVVRSWWSSFFMYLQYYSIYSKVQYSSVVHVQ